VHLSELAHRHVHRVGDIVKEGEQVECKVISVDTEEQRMSLSLKATIPAPVSAAEQAAAEAEQEAENEPPPPPYQPKSNKPLKGGLGEGPTGERFGLKW
jgi:small subunit ribosomal protein S1